MKKILAVIAVCLMSFQFATAQDINAENNVQEQMPQFVGGDQALADWIENNISYPMMSDLNFVAGRVVVSFVIDENGFVDNIQVEESSDPMFADELVNRLSMMPQWIPAIQNGRNVSVKFTLPFSFIAS